MNEKTYYIRSARENEREFCFMPDTEKALKYKFCGQYHATFTESRKPVSFLFLGSSEQMKNKEMLDDAKTVIRSLQNSYGSSLFSSLAAMRRTCEICIEDKVFDNGVKSEYTFAVHSDRYIYFIRCVIMPEDRDCECWLYCYDFDTMIAAGLEPARKEQV